MEVINSIIYNQTDFKSELENRFEIYRDLVLDDFLSFSHYDDFTKIINTFYEVITEDKNNSLPSIYNYCNFPINSFLNITLDELIIEEILTDIFAIKYIYLFGYYNKSEAQEIYEIFNSTNNFNIPLKSYANYGGTKLNDSNYVKWALEKKEINKNYKIGINSEYNETNRFIKFTEYNLKTSCLTDMLIYILSKDRNIIKNDISIISLEKTDIYLGFTFKNGIIENKKFMNDIIEWLEENEEMGKNVDVIGDRFYYLLKGYKKIKSLKHYNIIDSAISISDDNLYKTVKNNNILEFTFDEYQLFIKEIKKYINSGVFFVEIVSNN